MISPGPHRYVSSEGALQSLGEHLENYGERALIVGNKTALERYESTIRSSLKDVMIGSSFEVCLGECCLPEIERVAEEAREENSDMIVGVGTGRTMDVVKYASSMVSQACVTVPTVAGSAASYTDQVYLYTEDGEFLKREGLETCPELLLLDYAICGHADESHLVAGMGSSLAQTFPRKLTREELEVNHPRQMAYDLSRTLRDGLFDRGESALQAVTNGEITRDLETVLDMNVLHAGMIAMLGGRYFRAELAQYLAFHLLKYTSSEVLFGHVASFGLLVQELLRTGQKSNLEELIDFYGSVGLPMTFEELGLPDNQRESILGDAAEATVGVYHEGRNQDETLEVGELVSMISRVDELGRAVRQSGVDVLTD